MIRILLLVPALSAVFAAAALAGGASTAAEPSTLRPASEFSGIPRKRERSIALFTEAGKVLQHPRCMNCHPVERRPTQGMDMHPHEPPVFGGEDGRGVPGFACSNCHGQSNVDVAAPGSQIRSIPGDPHWSLAPASMGWQGLSLAEVCRQLKDRRRNGGRTLAQIHEHMAEDHLVGWAWHPGEGRLPAPGTQAQFDELIHAWIASGAACPPG